MTQTMLINLSVILVFIGVIVYLFIKDKEQLAKKIIYAMILEAEKKFGNKTGRLKYAYVSTYVYPMLPYVIRFFISQKQLDMWIEDGVTYFKQWLLTNDKDTLRNSKEL